MKKKILLLTTSLILLSCNPTNNYYPKEEIKLLEYCVSDNLISILYRAPLESMYYSSGIDYSYNEKCNQIELKFVRERIKSNSIPMLKSILLKNTNDSTRINKYGEYIWIVKIPIKKIWDLDNPCENTILKMK